MKDRLNQFFYQLVVVYTPVRLGTLGAVIFIASILVAPGIFRSPLALLLGFVTALCTVTAFFLPVATGLALVATAAVMSAIDDTASLYSLLWSVVVVAVYTHRTPWWFASGTALAMTYLGVADPFHGYWFSDDATSATVIGWLYGTAVLIGISTRQAEQKLTSTTTFLTEDFDDQRQALMRALHDSVAATMTSVVLRAEALALDESIDRRHGEELQLLAEEARSTMSEIRSLLDVMKSGELATPAMTDSTVRVQLRRLTESLESHGLVCHTTFELNSIDERTKFPHGFTTVLNELGANILKYAAPATVVRVTAMVARPSLVVELTNDISERQSASHMSTDLGLTDLEARITEFGGRYSGGVEVGKWHTRIVLPVSSLRSPPA